MWAVVIVVGAPCRDHAAGMAQRRYQVLVEAFLAHPSVEALDQAVLHGLSRRDVVPADLAVLLPFEHRITGQFGPIVADHKTWIPAKLGDPNQFAGDTRAADGCIDHSGQTFSAEVINDVWHTEPAAILQRIRHEVERPSLVRPLWDRHGRSRAHCALASTPLTNG